jgi:hypothetical protein
MKCAMAFLQNGSCTTLWERYLCEAHLSATQYPFDTVNGEFNIENTADTNLVEYSFTLTSKLVGFNNYAMKRKLRRSHENVYYMKIKSCYLVKTWEVK